MARKLTHEFVKSQLELAGYEMLSRYARSDKSIKFCCPRKHFHQIRWDDFKQGTRCGICSKEDQGSKNSNRLTHEYVKSAFELEGYLLLSEYKNSSFPLEFRCNNGHFHRIKWDHFKNGHRCSFCMGTHKVIHEYVESQFNAIGYQLLSPYKNTSSYLKFRCNNGHFHQIRWNDFQAGVRCGRCKGKIKLEHEYVKSRFESVGYELLSPYINALSPLTFRCDKGHIHETKWADFNAGVRCGACHASNFYQSYISRSASTISSRIQNQIKKLHYSAHWSYFYAEDQIKAISEPIEDIYKTCPKGHAVDHIVPVSWFNLLNEDELIACWSPANLRHLDAIANSKRQNKMTPEEIAFMEKNHPEIINAASRRPFIKVPLS